MQTVVGQVINHTLVYVDGTYSLVSTRQLEALVLSVVLAEVQGHQHVVTSNLA